MRKSWCWAVLSALVLAGSGCVDIKVGDEEDQEAQPPPRRQATRAPAPPEAPAPSAGTAPARREGVIGGAPTGGTDLFGSLGGSGLGGAASALGRDEGGFLSILEEIGRLASGITLGAEQGALLHGYDALALPGKSVDLTVRLRRAETLAAVTGARVGFYRVQDDREQFVGEALTGPNGLAVAPFTPESPGDYVFGARVLGVAEEKDAAMVNLAPARLVVAARPSEARIAVVDLDYTVVASSFRQVLLGTAKAMPDSREVLERIARDRTIVYLTHRPDLLNRRSKQWLMENGYPEGPVLMSDVGSLLTGSERFKSALLAQLRQVYPNVELGIGDKISDAASYARQNIQAYLIPHYDPKDAGEMRSLADEIRQLPPTVQVVRDWTELEVGLFGGRRFAPKTFAQRLERQAATAARLEEQEDDDDD